MIVTNAAGEKQVVVMCGEPEKEILRQMTELALENNTNITKAAKSLGINRTTLRMRMKAWGIANEKGSTDSD